MNKLFATVAIVAGLMAANTSANAGLFDAASALKGKMHDIRQTGVNRPTQTASPYSWMSNKGYMDCLHTYEIFGRSDAEKQRGVASCTRKYGSR